MEKRVDFTHGTELRAQKPWFKRGFVLANGKPSGTRHLEARIRRCYQYDYTVISIPARYLITNHDRWWSNHPLPRPSLFLLFSSNFSTRYALKNYAFIIINIFSFLVNLRDYYNAFNVNTPTLFNLFLKFEAPFLLPSYRRISKRE